MKARSQENMSRKGSYETDIYNLKISQETDTSVNIPKIRLLSDTTLESSKSPLDTKKQTESFSTSQYDSDLNISKNEKEITVIKNQKYTNENEKSLILDEQTVAIDNEEDKDETEEQDDCENIESTIKDDGKIKLWHDSLSLEESISGKEDWKELSREKTSRENIIITFDKCTTISKASLKPIKTKGDFRKKEVRGKKKRSIKVDVKLNEEKVFIPENKMETEVHEVIYVPL